jgi:N-acetyl-gamma-glutamyl-phosphate reductase
MIKAGIINVTGYAGVELARILARHPEVEIATVTGRSAAGKRLSEVFPHLAAIDATITEDLTESVDVVFSALPHAASAERLGPMLSNGVRAVDISADFRLQDMSEYADWYQVDHPYPELVEDAVYGLPELGREDIAGAKLVANPGCYPTAAILAIAPALKAGLIEADVIVDAKSGVSGAGRKVSVDFLYSEVNENLKAYSMGGHRHMPEISQEMRRIDPSAEPRVTFVPHLVPMTRGILATCYAPLKPGVSGEGLEGVVREAYESFYADAPFAHVAAGPPETKHTLGNNDCIVYPTVDTRTGRLISVGCIDNLVKGAAGQAVQNMNLMFGMAEDEGLRQLALYP